MRKGTGGPKQLSKHGASCGQVEFDTAAAVPADSKEWQHIDNGDGNNNMRAGKEMHNCKQQRNGMRVVMTMRW